MGATMKNIPRLSREMSRRFWSSNECWVWAGHALQSGYCQFRIGNKRYRVHRISYFLEHGKQPKGIIMHSCDNRKCCNPAHLIDGTNADNSADMVRKGRSAKQKGEEHGGAKLCKKDVQHIRCLKGTCTQLGERFGVSPSLISQIKTRKIWQHLG